MNEFPADPAILPYASAVIRLLQGTVFDDDTVIWSDLLNHQHQIHAFFRGIGINLYLDEREGFAYLTQPDTEDESTQIPRLVRRHALSYELALLLAVLRERLEKFDDQIIDSARCLISRQDIVDELEMLVGEKSNQCRMIEKIDSHINAAENHGFLKKIVNPDVAPENPDYEIRRVIKAKISNEKLEEIKRKLEEHDRSV